MVRKQRASFVLICLVGLALILLAACNSKPDINSRWRSEPPSSLLYEYRDDGTVLLIKGETTYQVFRYKFIDDDSIRLYDGMGRVQEYDFRISGDVLSFYADLEKGNLVERFRREI